MRGPTCHVGLHVGVDMRDHLHVGGLHAMAEGLHMVYACLAYMQAGVSMHVGSTCISRFPACLELHVHVPSVLGFLRLLRLRYLILGLMPGRFDA